MVKKILIGLLVVLVIMQFIRPAKNAIAELNAQDITHQHTVPDNVHQILMRSCYDCHSNSTAYPWYDNIQPVAWWLNDHINEGKRHLNFSQFGELDKAKQAKKLKSIAKTVTNNEMPLNSYLWIHKDAVLNDEQKKVIYDWATSLSQQIAMGTH